MKNGWSRKPHPWSPSCSSSVALLVLREIHSFITIFQACLHCNWFYPSAQEELYSPGNCALICVLQAVFSSVKATYILSSGSRACIRHSSLHRMGWQSVHHRSCVCGFGFDYFIHCTLPQTQTDRWTAAWALSSTRIDGTGFSSIIMDLIRGLLSFYALSLLVLNCSCRSAYIIRTIHILTVVSMVSPQLLKNVAVLLCPLKNTLSSDPTGAAASQLNR